MKLRFNILVFLSVVIMLSLPVHAQLFVAYKAGITKYNVEIDDFGDNYYESLSPSLLNLEVWYESSGSRWSLNLSTYHSLLTPDIAEIDYFDINEIDFTRHKLEIDYLKNVAEFSGLQMFLGLGFQAHESAYSKKTESSYYQETTEFEESVVSDLSILGAVEYEWNNMLIQVNAGAGMINHRLINKYYWYDERRLFGTGPNLFHKIVSKINVRVPLTKRISLNPEYSFRYYRHEDYSEMKVLQQYVLLAAVVQI